MFMTLLRRAFLFPAMMLFAADGDGGAGGNGGSGNPDAGGADGGDKGKKPDAGGNGGRTYSEEEANRIATEREERARKAALKSYFEQQGYAQEQVEELLKKDKETREAAKTEAQKEKEKREAAERERDQAKVSANARLAKAAFLVQAMAAGIPADRVEDAAALAAGPLADLKPDDKGDFETDDVKKIAEDLVKVKPWLKGEPGQGGNVGGGSNPGGGGAVKPEDYGKQAAEERNKAPQAGSGGYDPWASK